MPVFVVTAAENRPTWTSTNLSVEVTLLNSTHHFLIVMSVLLGVLISRAEYAVDATSVAVIVDVENRAISQTPQAAGASVEGGEEVSEVVLEGAEEASVLSGAGVGSTATGAAASVGWGVSAGAGSVAVDVSGTAGAAGASAGSGVATSAFTSPTTEP